MFRPTRYMHILCVNSSSACSYSNTANTAYSS